MKEFNYENKLLFLRVTTFEGKICLINDYWRIESKDANDILNELKELQEAVMNAQKFIKDHPCKIVGNRTLTGFIETATSVSSFELNLEKNEFYEFYIDGDFDDSIYSIEEMIESYGDVYYESKQDYKKDKSKSIREWIKNANQT